jgi:hypothetical protein
MRLEGAGGTFTKIVIPEECVFEGEYPVKGLMLVEDCEGTLETERLEHLLKEAASATLALSEGLAIKGFLGATINGGVVLEVIDKAIMKTFSGLAK